MLLCPVSYFVRKGVCVQEGSFLLASGLFRLEEFRVKMGTTVREIYIVPWIPMFVDHKIFNGIFVFS